MIALRALADRNYCSDMNIDPQGPVTLVLHGGSSFWLRFISKDTTADCITVA
jgi:hypothetical protein